MKAFFDVDLPSTRVCPGHSTPLDFLTDIFFELNSLILGVANRDGMKTLTLAIADVLDLQFKAAGILHAGAIEEQARKGYDYCLRFIKDTFFDQVAGGEMLMSRTRFKNGGTLEIAPMTMNRMAGPHEPKLRRDETDLAKEQALSQSTGTATSKRAPDGTMVKLSIVDTSTRYNTYGNVQEMMDNALADGRSVHHWCYKEVTERCPDDRSGTGSVTAFVDPVALHGIDQKEFDKLTGVEKTQYEKIHVLDGCLQCRLMPSCRGDLKRANGHTLIDDLIVKFRASSASTWIAQMESKEPVNEGAVFTGEFKERYHVRASPYRLVVDDELRREADFYRCMDLGRIRPSVGWVAWIRKQQRLAHFHEFEPNNMELNDVKINVMQIDARYGLRPEDFVCTWVDPSATQRTDLSSGHRFALLGKDNEKVRYDLRPRIPARLGVWEGVEEIKRLLKIGEGMPQLEIVQDTCPETIKAFKSYRRRKDPRTGLWLNEVQDPQEAEHTMDRFRYLVVGLLSDVPAGARIVRH